MQNCEYNKELVVDKYYMFDVTAQQKGRSKQKPAELKFTFAQKLQVGPKKLPINFYNKQKKKQNKSKDIYASRRLRGHVSATIPLVNLCCSHNQKTDC